MAAWYGGVVTVAVCDDESRDLQQIAVMAGQLLEKLQAAYQITSFSGPEALQIAVGE